MVGGGGECGGQGEIFFGVTVFFSSCISVFVVVGLVIAEIQHTRFRVVVAPARCRDSTSHQRMPQDAGYREGGGLNPETTPVAFRLKRTRRSSRVKNKRRCFMTVQRTRTCLSSLSVSVASFFIKKKQRYITARRRRVLDAHSFVYSCFFLCHPTAVVAIRRT